METLITKLLHLPPVASEHGQGLDNLMLYVHLLMFALLLGWGAFFLYALWRFRQSRSAKANPEGVRSHVSSYLEVGVAVVEGILLIGFAVPLWARGASFENFPDEKEATVVKVIGRQFNWMAWYPGADGVFGRSAPEFVGDSNPLGVDPDDANGKDDVVVESSDVYAPVGKPVVAHISSLDVIHSFSVKSMRVTQDAIPGLSIPVWFTPTVEGTYQITCAQLCGQGHSSMRGLFHAVTPAEFTSWLGEHTRTSGEQVSYE
ncbi:MAG: cytochrome c oxidase subunit II [Verrucomicrobiales bacterium]|nr:cytochrome c oxidase subunit II [Verrucomicrobiales bacterium]MCP5525405.1 cytochrome c oxidase subunit II [Verrucomicrobiales bacterium]